MQRENVVWQLREMAFLRQRLNAMEMALQELTPEQRLVVDRLVIHPAPGNLAVVCELLELEKSSVYRRKYQALDKLAKVLSRRRKMGN